jgi:hypothetical protein
MKTASMGALAALALALAGCAGGRAQAPKQAAATPPQPEQVSPAHPYCMFIPRAGELRECYQFAFGRCTAWGSGCHTPGWIRPADQATGGAAAP